MKDFISIYTLFILNSVAMLLPLSSASAAARGKNIVALASSPRLEWVEPGVASLGFTCPSSVDLGDDDVIRIVPCLTDDSGKRCFFPEVIYQSRLTRRFRERRQTFRPKLAGPGARLLSSGHPSDTLYAYRDTLPVGSFRNPRLEISYYYSNCCREYRLLTDTVAVPSCDYGVRQLLPFPLPVNRVPVASPSVVFVRPAGERVKRRRQTVSVPLHYRVDHSEVERGYLDNARHLAYLDSACMQVFVQRDDYHIDSINIVGYASPEGGFDYNLRLSERRARSFAAYVSERFRVHLAGISVRGAGEDWEGLSARVLADSLFRESAEVLSVIRNYDIFSGREKRLMELRGGAPYRYMLRHHFPHLRRMELEVCYTVRAFTAQEALRVLATRPQDLDAGELYGALRQLASDSLQFTPDRDNSGSGYDLAATLHPEDVPTRINAASAALLRYDLTLAGRYLGSLLGEPLAWNNVGVYYWMCGDLVRAREYFRLAAEHTPEAKENLKRMEEWEAAHGGK